VAHAVAFAQASGADRLVLFHHDPMHSDDELERIGARARELWGDDGPPPELAREGTQLAIEPAAQRLTR
jgi:hypothetical protein